MTDYIDKNKKIYNPKFYPDNELMGKSGIYQIRNLQNGKLYIGSSCRLYERKLQHKNDLKSNRHENIYLQNSYNFHGKDNFIFEIIEFCEPEDRYKIEQYWLDLFYGNEFCYNINPIASKPPDCTGKHFTKTKEQIEKVRTTVLKNGTFKGKNNPMYGKRGCKNSKSIKFISLADSIIYDGFREYERITGKNRSVPLVHCKNKLKNKTQMFMYLDEYNLLSIKEKEIIKNNAIKNINKSKIIRLLDNKLYNNVKECSTDNNITESSLYHCLSKVKNDNKFIRYNDWLDKEMSRNNE